MNVIIEKNIKEQTALRESFNALATKTFNLSFEQWFQDGYWTDKYIPYAIVDDGKVVANASVNIMNTIWQGCMRRYIQIGTVMTDEDYRNQGLSRRLMDEILNDWEDKCDAIYLFANKTVLEFYPKFGFEKVMQFQHELEVTPKQGNVKRLNMSRKEEREFLQKYYEKSNPFSELPMLNNFELLMFYCSSFMSEHIYYCEDYDAVVIAIQDRDTFVCFDIYCEGDKDLADIISVVSESSIQKAVLQFTPKNLGKGSISPIHEGEDILFILKENLFVDNKLMFPSLCHA